MERNLALELVRVTEAAALASARWMGKGDAAAADKAARAAVATVLRSVKMAGRVVLGDADTGVKLPRRRPSRDVPAVDIVVDALQSTESVAHGGDNAISVIALSDRGGFLAPPLPYMDKVAVGEDAAGAIDIRATPLDNLVNIADAKRCYVEDLTVCILERERNQALIDEVRRAGARIQLLAHGDLAAALAAAIPGSGVDVVVGIGGSVEGILAAAALRCMGGDMQARAWERDEDDAEVLSRSGHGRADRVLRLDALAPGENTMFAATGITSSAIVRGVRFVPGGAVTHSVVMRARSGTVRLIETSHRFDRKPSYR
jgi:fructose-1,6-bisphosphatase II